MAEQLIIAVVPSAVVAIITLVGVLQSNKTSAAVRDANITAKFDALEKEISDLRADFAALNTHVKEHNNLAVRMSVMEQRADGADARIKKLEKTA